MRYDKVCLESFGYALPEEIVTTLQIERALAPLYERIGLPEGRLELMTGIRERRFWKPGTRPSEKSAVSAQRAIDAAGIDKRDIGALIHASVCRDHLEPATAARVHHLLGLPQECLLFDVSNACLGILNGMMLVANMIELGQIRAGLVVGTESGRDLVENTIETLNRDTSITRNQVKLAVASLTIGSASCAVLLVDRRLSQTNNRLLAAVAQTNTDHHELCHSTAGDDGAGGTRPLMQTDSETMMHAGVATGAATFEQFLMETDWTRDEIDKTFCHQVGVAHRRLMFDSLGLDLDNDFPTIETLGNTGSVALPISMAMGLEAGHVERDEQIAMMGIGSGINCLMLAARWQRSLVGGERGLFDSKQMAAVGK
jgi:3-oxoacyl-[acyl-carrier-protein] synthase-3